MPSGKTKVRVGLSVVGKSVCCVSSTVTTVVELTAESLPPRLTPARTGSLISITAPGRTKSPASNEVVKVQSSDSLPSENEIALANL